MPLLNDPTTKRNRYDRRHAAMVSARQSFMAHYRDLAEMFMPRRLREQVDDTTGERRGQDRQLDSTARYAARTLSSGMHSGMTSPARPWMKVTTVDPDRAKFRPAAIWLSQVTRVLLDLFATTNLYNVLPTVYLDEGIFATGAMSMLRDTKNPFRCYAYPTGSYVVGVDSRGVVNTFIREWNLTIEQLVEQFCVREDGRSIDWSGASETVRRLWDRGDYDAPVTIRWITTPNEAYRPNALDAREKKYASCYYEVGSTQGKFLKESGFDSFPFMVPRWDVTAPEDAYGLDSPGMTVLGDVRQLQNMQRRKGQLLSKAVDPPLKGPSSLRNQKTSLVSGDITYVDGREGSDGLAPIHEVRLEGFQHLTADINDVRYMIRRGMYEDLFLMIAESDNRLGADRPTAEEIRERHEEKLLALGPTVERNTDELLNPVVDRAFEIAVEDDLLPPAPEALQGQQLKVEMTSLLAQAQKLVGVVSHERFISSVIGVGQVLANALDKLNIDQAIDDLGEMLGVDPRIIVETEQAQEQRTARARAQQTMLDAEAAAKYAKASRDAADTPLTGDSLLNRIVSGAQQQPGVAPQQGA